MDELKNRAGEKLEALQVAAKTAADNGKSRLHDAVHKTTDAVRSVHKVFHDLWNNELILEVRLRARAWTDEAVRRIREGAPPLSPVLLYEELVALWHDRVWRRSMMIFACGVLIGGSAGVLIGVRMSRHSPAGPHSRALHSHADQTVILVEDSLTPVVGPGEVLVRVQAFSVCVVDRGVLRGRANMLRSLVYRGHVTVGRGFSGVVLDVGQGVTEFELGDEVWGCISEWSGGAATELLTIRSTRLSKRPVDLPADEAASLTWSGTEALIALRKLSFTPLNCKGKRVAVCCANAGVGCVLVQLLSKWGASVTASAHRTAAPVLQVFGSQEFVDLLDSPEGPLRGLADRAIYSGPWDAVFLCPAAELATAPKWNPELLLRATAPRNAVLDLRPGSLISDRLPAPLSFMFAASFYGYRILRWVFGYGSDTDWLEDRYRLKEGLDMLRKLVEERTLKPTLDKVYLPEEFETALAFVCGEDAFGDTVVRFP